MFIAAYSIVDGIGIRVSGSPVSYIGWLFVAEIFVPLFVLARFPKRLIHFVTRTSLLALAGGIMSGLAYGLVLYAKTLVPLGVVSALRETSVIFAALIWVFVMGERPIKRRILAATVVAVGVVILLK